MQIIVVEGKLLIIFFEERLQVFQWLLFRGLTFLDIKKRDCKISFAVSLNIIVIRKLILSYDTLSVHHHPVPYCQLILKLHSPGLPGDPQHSWECALVQRI